MNASLVHQSQLQFRNRRQQHETNRSNVLRNPELNISSSSNNATLSNDFTHRVAAGLQLAHNKLIAHSGILSEAIELKTFPPSSPSGSFRVANLQKDRYKDSILPKKKINKKNLSDDREIALEEGYNCKRSQSYHEKGSVK